MTHTHKHILYVLYNIQIKILTGLRRERLKMGFEMNRERIRQTLELSQQTRHASGIFLHTYVKIHGNKHVGLSVKRMNL